MRLYDLAAQYSLLAETEDADAFTLALSQLEDGITDRAEQLAMVIRSLEAEESAFEHEAARLLAQAQSRRAHIDRVKSYLLSCLESSGLRSVKGTLFTVRLRDNPPAVTVLDDLSVPLEFIRTKPPVAEVDKQAILAAWRESGIVPPGVQVHRSTRLEIR